MDEKHTEKRERDGKFWPSHYDRGKNKTKRDWNTTQDMSNPLFVETTIHSFPDQTEAQRKTSLLKGFFKYWCLRNTWFRAVYIIYMHELTLSLTHTKAHRSSIQGSLSPTCIGFTSHIHKRVWRAADHGSLVKNGECLILSAEINWSRCLLFNQKHQFLQSYVHEHPVLGPLLRGDVKRNEGKNGYGFPGGSWCFALLRDSSRSLISLKDWSSSSASDVLRDVTEHAETASLDSALDVCKE